MASQEFLASFAVDIDEGGVSRLQSVLETEGRFSCFLLFHLKHRNRPPCYEEE